MRAILNCFTCFHAALLCSGCNRSDQKPSQQKPGQNCAAHDANSQTPSFHGKLLPSIFHERSKLSSLFWSLHQTWRGQNLACKTTCANQGMRFSRSLDFRDRRSAPTLCHLGGANRVVLADLLIKPAIYLVPDHARGVDTAIKA